MMEEKRTLAPSIDDIGRQSIIKDLGKNLFVIAGAGSGKTSMLVSRMVAMVESGIDISKICAITFTKKAAAEFLSRFQSKLKERSKPPFKEGDKYPGDLPTPTEITAERCQKALKDIDLCFTGTIDSFCNLVLSEYPNNANIPSSSMVVQEDELFELYKKEYEKIANGENCEIKDKFEIFNKLFSNGADVFSRSIYDVVEVSHINIKYPKPIKSLDQAVKDLSDKYASKIKSDIRTLISMKDLVVQTSDGLKAFEKLENESQVLLSDWNVSNFVSIRKSIYYTFKEALRFVDEPSLMFFEFGFMSRNKCYKCLEKKDSESLKAYFNDVDEIIYSYSMDFLIAVTEIIKQNLRKQGKLSFTEYLMIFRNMVINDMDKGMTLIKHIKNKHSYFLIDESQDTSPAQTELFIYLTSEVVAHSLNECQPKPGSIFIVGDPKQSIYGFRGADVNAYLNTKDLFEKVYDSNTNKVIYLTKNFRSNIELIRYFNKQFGNGNLANYEPIPEITNETPDEISKDVIAGLYISNNYLDAIKTLVGRYYIYDKRIDDKEKDNNIPLNQRTFGKRLIEYKDIMLLTWTTTRHDRMLKELSDNDIPVYCEGKFSISDCGALNSIYAIYAYLAGESGQFQNLLSSPLFNSSPISLLGISSLDDIPEGKEKDLLLSIESLRDINNPVHLLENIVNTLKIYQYISYTNTEYVLYTVEKLKEAQASQQVSDIRSGEKFLRDFISNKLERCMNMESTPNAVNLANVHKVKGLEKPVVILAESPKKKKEAEKDSNYINDVAYVFKTASKDGSNGSKTYDIECGGLYSNEQEKAFNKSEEENNRLRYVAVTRARNVLIFNNTSDMWSNVRPSVIEDLPSSNLVGPTMETLKELSFDEPGEFNITESYWQKSPSKKSHIFSKFDDSEIEETQVEDDIDVRTRGTLIHRMMEMIINSKGKLAKNIIINNVLNEYSLSDNQTYKNILSSVYDTMFRGGYPQKNNAPQDLLGVAFNSTCLCEVPFSYKEGKMIWQGIIDLLYINEGKCFIVDYKTNEDDDNLEEEYKTQLEAYKTAAKKTLGVDVEAYIYHIGN